MVVGADQTARRRPVIVGLQDKGNVQISSGLSAKDQVISVGGYALDEGTKVKVVTADDAEKPTPGKSGEDK